VSEINIGINVNEVIRYGGLGLGERLTSKPAPSIIMNTVHVNGFMNQTETRRFEDEVDTL
jgi:hypothetical protein